MTEREDIQTFVVLDLETNGLPSYQFNVCAVTEISLYAFSAKCLMDKDLITKKILKNVTEDGVVGFDQESPELPRVLHKLTLMINPGSLINPTAERTTGLSNEMLEKESTFNKDTAECLNLFLDRLLKPICLVAHNGWSFDYPIIRYVYEKINMSFPSSIFCVDSLKAFREMDEKYDQIKEAKKATTILEADENHLQHEHSNNPLEENLQINWQRENETTPQRRKKHRIRQNNTDCSWPYKKLCVRRSLFTDTFTPKNKYPPKDIYKLGNIYKHHFKKDPVNLHRAESDVEILTKLILHYGVNFLAYAEERRQLFTEVPKLGSLN